MYEKCSLSLKILIQSNPYKLFSYLQYKTLTVLIFLMDLGRDDWDYETIVRPDIFDVCSDGSKLDNGVESGIYSREVDLNISLRLRDYCTVWWLSTGPLNGYSPTGSLSLASQFL